MKLKTLLLSLLLSISLSGGVSAEIPEEIVQAYKNKDYKAVFLLSKKLAEQNNSKFQVALSYLYFGGIGVKKNEHKGFEWLLKSANQNNIVALSELADYYITGIRGVVLTDKQKAINIYKKLIELEPRASKNYEYRIASVYKNYIMDNVKAIYWYDKSSDKGHYLAQISLAELLLKQSKWKDDANEYKQKAKVLIQKVFENNDSTEFVRKHAEDLWTEYRLGDLLVE